MTKFLDRFFRYLRFRRIKPFIKKGSVVYDIGCGSDAWFLRTISPRIKTGIGVDKKISEQMFGNIEIKNLFIDDILPGEDGSADVVTMMAVFEHMQNPTTVLKEIHRLLKPGGFLLVTVPTFYAKPVLEILAFWLHIIDEEEIRDHKRYLGKAELKKMFSDADFKADNIKVRYFEGCFNLLGIAKK